MTGNLTFFLYILSFIYPLFYIKLILMCNQKKAVSRGSLLAVVINQAVEAKSCQRRRCNKLSILSAGWMTSKNLGKRLRNHSKGWVQYQAPLKMSPCGYKGGRAGEGMTQGLWGTTGNFCMAKHIVPSLAHGKALLCFS